ncbi:hypothetical protein ACOME3_003423 [Neoechinorhynchus agilis]
MAPNSSSRNRSRKGRLVKKHHRNLINPMKSVPDYVKMNSGALTGGDLPPLPTDLLDKELPHTHWELRNQDSDESINDEYDRFRPDPSTFLDLSRQNRETPAVVRDINTLVKPAEELITRPLGILDELKMKKIDFIAFKNELSQNCVHLIENPHERISLLKVMCSQLTGIRVNSSLAREQQRLLIASLTRVLCEITPGHRIRKLTNKEMSDKVKRETRSVRTFEQCLLKQYSVFVEYLIRTLKGTNWKLLGIDNIQPDKIHIHPKN